MPLRQRRWIREIAFFTALLAAVFAFTQWRGAGETPEFAPPVRVQALDGQVLDLARPQGRAVLVNFWAPDCPPCIAEIPALNGLQRLFGGERFTVLGVMVSGQGPEGAQKAVQRFGIRYPVAVDEGGAVSRAFGGVSLTPTSVLIAPDGRVLGRYVGAISLPWLALRIAWLHLAG